MKHLDEIHSTHSDCGGLFSVSFTKQIKFCHQIMPEHSKQTNKQTIKTTAPPRPTVIDKCWEKQQAVPFPDVHL